MVYRGTSASTLNKMSSWTLEKAYRENTQYTALLSPKIRIMVPRQIQWKNDPLGVGKNMWKRIPHVIQRHQTPSNGCLGKIAKVQFLDIKL